MTNKNLERKVLDVEQEVLTNVKESEHARKEGEDL